MAPPRKYVTIEEFKHFLSNDFYHMAREVRLHTWILLTIAGALIAKLIWV